MKRNNIIGYLIAFFCLLVAACEDSGLLEKEGSSVIPDNPSQPTYTLEVSPKKLENIKAEGETRPITVTSNDSWTVSVSKGKEWIQLDKTAGDNNAEISVTITANLKTEERTGTITVSGVNSRERLISVTQRGKEKVSEIYPKTLWINETVEAIPAWNNIFLFCNEENMNGEEIYAFSMEDWALIKEGTIFVGVELTETSNIRVCDGWWSTTYGGSEHNCIDFVKIAEDGTTYLELNIKEEGNLYNTIDEKHLLFSGEAYTITSITAVSGTNPNDPKWGYLNIKSNGRNFTTTTIPATTTEVSFDIESNCSWEIETISDSNKMINGFDPSSKNGAGNKRVTVLLNENTSYEQQMCTIKVSVPFTSISKEISVTQQGIEKTSEDSRKLLWTNETGEIIPAWSGIFRFCNEENMNGEEIYAFSMEDWALIKEGTIFVGVELTETSNIRVCDGWWSTTYGGSGHNCIDFVKIAEDGTTYLELNIKEEGNLYNTIDEKHLLFTGDAYTITSITAVSGTNPNDPKWGYLNIKSNGRNFTTTTIPATTTEVSFDVESNCSWEIETISDSNIMINGFDPSSKNGSGNKRVTVLLNANTTNNQRKCDIKISAPSTSFSEKITITQEGGKTPDSVISIGEDYGNDQELKSHKRQ